MTNGTGASGDPRSRQAEAARSSAGSARRWRDLGPRTASAVVLIAIALTSLWRGGTPFALFWLAAAIGLLWEWQRLIGGSRLLARVLVGAASVAVATYFAKRASLEPALFALGVGVAAAAAIAQSGRRMWSGAGVLYAGALVMAVCVLRFSVLDGALAVGWLFAVVWGADVMAYFGGRLIGGPKLWPRASPSKTWAGLLVCVSFGALLGALILEVHHAPLGEGAALALGALTGIVSQAGDLFESFMKRWFGTKDSSGLIPGHGGLMDRLDGFLAATTFAAILGIARAGVAAAGLGLFRW